RLSLAEKKIECELIEERYWEEHPDFHRRNPARKVPVLRIDGRTLPESSAICEYLEEKHPDPPLMPRSPEGRYEVRRLVTWFDDKFHHEVTSKLLYERVNKKMMGKGFPDSGNVKSGSRAIKYHLDYMAFLLDHRRWLAGDVMTLADFAAAAHLSSRSEEHTSELQSRENLVCRLLLEKKKKITVQDCRPIGRKHPPSLPETQQ